MPNGMNEPQNDYSITQNESLNSPPSTELLRKQATVLEVCVCGGGHLVGEEGVKGRVDTLGMTEEFTVFIVVVVASMTSMQVSQCIYHIH